MIKFFRKMRYDLMEKNKTGKYLKYAIGEIVLVVIGILIALSINNWNEKQKKEKQIRNIYARIVKDFNQTVVEIERDVAYMDSIRLLMREIRRGEIVRDSMLTNPDYFIKYWRCTTGFPDIKIVDTGVRLLESKIELDYELNTGLTEELTLLYSEHLFEFEIDTEDLTHYFRKSNDYLIEKGIYVDYITTRDPTKFTNMVFEDAMFKNYFFPFSAAYAKYSNRLKSFKTKGQVLIDKIKTEYNLE